MPEPLSLPAPSSRTLGSAPLELVVCQVQHDRNHAVGDAARILLIRDALGGQAEYPGLEPFNQQEIEVSGSVGGPVSAGLREQAGWRLRSADGSWLIALTPNFFALECTRYTRWGDFRPRLLALAEAVGEILSPQLELRIGLRYVDRVALGFADPREWRGNIHEALLGPLSHDDLGASVMAAQQLAQFKGPGDTEVILRHGIQEEPVDHSWSYVIDTDCYRVAPRALAPDVLIDTADDLHRLCVQMFQSVVTPELRMRLGEEEDPA